MAQGHDRLASAVKLFLTRVSVNALGNPNHRNIIDAPFAHYIMDSANLSRPTINQQ